MCSRLEPLLTDRFDTRCDHRREVGHVHHQPHPNRPQDRPPRGRRWPLLVGLLVVLLAGLTAAAALLHRVSQREDRIGFTATGIHQLVIGLHAGRVELVPSPDGRIQVTTTRHWSVWAPTARQRQVGDILALSGDCPPLGDLGITDCAVDQRITVPTGTRLRLTASTVDLIATDLAAASLEAHLTRGSITASFTRPPDRILARLDAGKLRLTLPSATYAVDAAAPRNAGHVTVEVRTDPAAPRKISAHISRGDLRSFADKEDVHKCCLPSWKKRPAVEAIASPIADRRSWQPPPRPAGLGVPRGPDPGGTGGGAAS
jgi:hypothetical protein